MQKRKFLLAGVIGLVILVIALFNYSVPVVHGDEFILFDGYSGKFSGSSEEKTFAFYQLKIPVQKVSESETVVSGPDLFAGIEGVFYPVSKGVTSYSPSQDGSLDWANAVLMHLDSGSKRDYELYVRYLPNGKIDLSKTVLASVPDQYQEGRPIKIDISPEDEKIANPHYDLETLKRLKPDKDISELERAIQESNHPTQGFAAEVCFDPSLPDMPQTGLCNYYTVGVYTTQNQVLPEHLSDIRGLISKMVDHETNPAPALAEGETIDGTPDVGPTPSGELVKDPNMVVWVDNQIVPKGSQELPPPKEEVHASSGKKGIPLSASLSVLPPKKLDFYYTPTSEASFSSTTLFYESFEGNFPTGSWVVSDLDATNGSDYWDDAFGGANTGSWDAWASQVGTQWVPVSTDSFPGSSLSGWTTSDSNPASGNDTWGYSTHRSSSSPGSAYSAGASSTGGLFYYDTYMTAFLTKDTSFNASSWSNARIRFNTWFQTEQNYDYLYVIVQSNGGPTWNTICSYSGNSGGWTSQTCTIPAQYYTSQLKIGFVFMTDGSDLPPGSHYEGAYVDDVTLEKEMSNQSVTNYDDGQSSYMQYGPVSVNGFGNTVFDFWLKGTVEPSNDSVQVERSFDNSAWYTLDTIYPSSPTWTHKSYNFSSTTGNFYFRISFHSNGTIHSYTGPYVDDIKVYGYTLLPDGAVCSSANECLSGICGGAHTDYYIHCHSDGGSTVFGDQRIFVNTCGGAGTFDHTNFDNTSQSCPSSKVCDSDLAYYNSTFTPALICKNTLLVSCSASSECWNDNGGVDCMGSSSKICTYGNNGDYCTENAQCDSNQCYNNTCSTGLPNGSACTSDSACASQLCVSNICQAPAAYHPSISRTDSWDASTSAGASTSTDGAVFVNGTVYPTTTGLREQTDMLCYDLNGDGSFDACYYDPNGCSVGGCSATSCNSFSIPAGVSNKYACDIDSPTGCRIGQDGGTSPKICSGSGCLVSTSTGADFRQIQAKAYTDCDDSNHLRSETSVESPFSDAAYVVDHAKYYEAFDNTLNQTNFFTIGQFGYSDVNAYETTSAQCPANQAVDRVSEEQRVYTPGGIIPSVCKKIPGQACTLNSDCLYNVCSGNQCQLSGGIKGHLSDETGHPIGNQAMKLYSCSNTLLSTNTTDSYGKFGFYITPGNYILKTVASWGETVFVWSGEPSGCHSYGTGFSDIWTRLFTHAHIHGRALDPQGQPSVGLPFAATTCQNTTLDTDTTNPLGNFSLDTPTGNQSLKVNINGTFFPVTDTNNNACLFRAGDVDVGDLPITSNCSLYNNTCSSSNPDVRLFNCSNSASNGCSCAQLFCEAGCTDGAPQCNVVGTGTFKVTVSDVNGNPLPYVDVSVDNVPRGKTNGWGKKDINVLHGMHAVRATCPGGTPTQQVSAYLNGNQKYVSYTLNCPAQPKGDLKVVVNDVNGLPLANVYVFIDEDNQIKNITDLVGVSSISGINYGAHTITYGLKFDENTQPTQVTQSIDINALNQSITQTIIFPGQPGYAQQNISNEMIFADPSTIRPLFRIFIVQPIIDTVVSVDSYCSCVYPNLDHATQLQSCITSGLTCLSQTSGVNGIKLNNQTCAQWFRNNYDAAGVCVPEIYPAAITIGASVVPWERMIGFAVKPAIRVIPASIVDRLGAFTGNFIQAAENFGSNINLTQFTQDIARFNRSERGYIGVRTGAGNSISYKAAIDALATELELNPTKLTESGSAVALKFAKAIENRKGLAYPLVKPKISGMDVGAGRDLTDFFNGLGKLDDAGKNVGFIVNGETVSTLGNSKIRIIIDGIEDSGIKGLVEEIDSAATKYFDVFDEFPTDGLGDLKLSGNRRVEVKIDNLLDADSQPITDYHLLEERTSVREGALQMIDIMNAFPNPAGGKHLFQFHNLTNSQRTTILQIVANYKGVAREVIEETVDVVSYV